jgi:hypothetical protein
MANKANRFLFAITMLAAMFAYSCYSSGGDPSCYAKIAKANWISYTSLYPDVTMEPGGYYLNEMVNGPQYANDICNYYIDNILSEEERDLYISQAGGSRYYAINYCIENNEQDHINTNDTKEFKNWIKSANTPYNDAINKEVFDKYGGDFLGFYYVGEQEYYIYVSFMPGG